MSSAPCNSFPKPPISVPPSLSLPFDKEHTILPFSSPPFPLLVHQLLSPLLCSAVCLQHFSFLPCTLAYFPLYHVIAISIQTWCSGSHHTFLSPAPPSGYYLISSQQSSSGLLHLLSQNLILPFSLKPTPVRCSPHHFIRAALVKVTSDLHVANLVISSKSSSFFP